MTKESHHIPMRLHFHKWDVMSVQTKAFEDNKAGEISNTYKGYFRRIYDAEINRLTSNNEAISV